MTLVEKAKIMSEASLNALAAGDRAASIELALTATKLLQLARLLGIKQP